jgi:hypothetical protein
MTIDLPCTSRRPSFRKAIGPDLDKYKTFSPLWSHHQACLELYAPENVVVDFSKRTYSLQICDGMAISPIRIMGFTDSWPNLELQILLDFSLTE